MDDQILMQCTDPDISHATDDVIMDATETGKCYKTGSLFGEQARRFREGKSFLLMETINWKAEHCHI